jgi:hypothetical protein
VVSCQLAITGPLEVGRDKAGGDHQSSIRLGSYRMTLSGRREIIAQNHR